MMFSGAGLTSPIIRTISASLGPCRVKAFLFHEALHDLLRDEHLLPDQRSLNSTITVGSMITFEYLDDGATDFGILVGNPHRRPMIKVTADKRYVVFERIPKSSL